MSGGQGVRGSGQTLGNATPVCEVTAGHLPGRTRLTAEVTEAVRRCVVMSQRPSEAASSPVVCVWSHRTLGVCVFDFYNTTSIEGVMSQRTCLMLGKRSLVTDLDPVSLRHQSTHH